MRSKALCRSFSLLLVLASGCSAESADPAGAGGSPSSGNGGSTVSSGGSNVISSGGSTSFPGSGGSTGGSSTSTPGSGGSAAPGTGGSTSTPGSGGSAAPGTGGSTTPAAGGSTPSSSGGSTAAGSAGAPATGGASAGTGGGGTPAAMGCPDGCAQLSVPFTAYKSSQSFEIYLDAAANLSAATINVRVRKVAGKAGGLQLIVKDGEAQNYAWAQSAWNGINELTSAWTTVSFPVATPTAQDMTNVFDPAQVRIISVQLNAGDPWFSDTAMTMQDPTALINPTLIQVDEISISGVTGTALGPWTFATEVMALNVLGGAAALAAMPPYAVMGSTVTWVGP